MSNRAIITKNGFTALAKYLMGSGVLNGQIGLAYFEVGTGGGSPGADPYNINNINGGKALLNPYTGGSPFPVQYTSLQLSYSYVNSVDVINIVCNLGSSDGNVGSTIFNEIGIFDYNDNLIVYCTFDNSTPKNIGSLMVFNLSVNF
jgi:hypothetical protein